MASIRDVATMAGVAPATVSRVLNNSGYVSENARIRIKEAMKELDYMPNELARNLYRKKAGIVALIVPDVGNPFFSQYVCYAESALFKYGYKTMICNTANIENAEPEYLDMLKRHIVDGIITGVHTLDVEEYSKIKKPVVSLDRFIDDEIPLVSSDHKMGGCLAAEELIRCGCKDVLHFCGSNVYNAPYLERHNEFERVMHEHGVRTHVYELDYNRMDNSYFRETVKAVFTRESDFDGIFGVDTIAIEAMNECIRRHKKIPKDVCVVAYDGTFVTDIVEPSLTAVVQPIEELAQKSVEILVKLMNGEKLAVKRVELPVVLRKGKST